MSKIKPFWRIVLGFVILCLATYNSSMLAFDGSFFAFAFWWAFLVAYIFAAIKIPYDDPLRSMRDLMARQQEEQAAQKAEENPAPDPAAEDRISALEKELADLKAKLHDRSDP